MINTQYNKEYDYYYLSDRTGKIYGYEKRFNDKQDTTLFFNKDGFIEGFKIGKCRVKFLNNKKAIKFSETITGDMQEIEISDDLMKLKQLSIFDENKNFYCFEEEDKKMLVLQLNQFVDEVKESIFLDDFDDETYDFDAEPLEDLDDLVEDNEEDLASSDSENKEDEEDLEEDYEEKVSFFKRVVNVSKTWGNKGKKFVISTIKNIKNKHAEKKQTPKEKFEEKADYYLYRYYRGLDFIEDRHDLSGSEVAKWYQRTKKTVIPLSKMVDKVDSEDISDEKYDYFDTLDDIQYNLNKAYRLYEKDHKKASSYIDYIEENTDEEEYAERIGHLSEAYNETHLFKKSIDTMEPTALEKMKDNYLKYQRKLRIKMAAVGLSVSLLVGTGAGALMNKFHNNDTKETVKTESVMENNEKEVVKDLGYDEIELGIEEVKEPGLEEEPKDISVTEKGTEVKEDKSFSLVHGILLKGKDTVKEMVKKHLEDDVSVEDKEVQTEEVEEETVEAIDNLVEDELVEDNNIEEENITPETIEEKTITEDVVEDISIPEEENVTILDEEKIEEISTIIEDNIENNRKLLEAYKEKLTELKDALPEEDMTLTENISIGSYVNVNEDSMIYSNIYDVTNHTNAEESLYKDTLPRVVEEIVLSNGEEIVNVKTSEEAEALENVGYEVTGYGLVNPYSENISNIEGRFEAEDVMLLSLKK